MQIALQHYLALAVVLFAVGAAGACVRRNIFVIFISIQAMFSSATLALCAFARWNLLPEGKAAVLFVVAVMAAQAAVGLAILVAVVKRCGTVQADEIRLLRD